MYFHTVVWWVAMNHTCNPAAVLLYKQPHECYHHRTKALIINAHAHTWLGSAWFTVQRWLRWLRSSACMFAPLLPSSAGNSIRMSNNVTWRTFGHTSYTVDIHCFRRSSIVSGQQIGEMQHSDLRSRLQKHRGSLAPSREVEDTGHWQLLLGNSGEDINRVISYQVIKAPSVSWMWTESQPSV